MVTAVFWSMYSFNRSSTIMSVAAYMATVRDLSNAPKAEYLGALGPRSYDAALQ